MFASVATRKSVGAATLSDVRHRFGAADEIAVLADVGRALRMGDGDGLRQLAFHASRSPTLKIS